MSSQHLHYGLKILLLLCMAGGILFSCFQDSSTMAIDVPKHPDFNFDIRPILSENCFLCHGPDESTREAGLRLDMRDGATAILKSGNQAILPGNWKKSELIKRISSSDPDYQMPPPEMKKRLNKRETELLKNWIQAGANWQPYWAFSKPEATLQVPHNRKIDYFINQQLERHNLKPAPEADRNTLIRRLSYLLTGLPPDPKDVEQFIKDGHPDAYEKLVDKYLSSPHFGERWARHWMDLARYADTKGHEFDYPILGAWRYRDYLVRAFNEDIPYDQLIKEHLAGDLLPSPRFNESLNTNESALGVSFLTLGEGTHSPVDLQKDEADRIDNMIDVTMKTFQGLTLGCARCHDHKFDPLPTADYYTLYGVFKSTRFSLLPAYAGLNTLHRIDSVETYKAAIRKLAAQPYQKPLSVPASNPQGPTFHSGQILDYGDSISNVKIIGDFRNGSLHGWFSDGPAFAGRNALGEPQIDFRTKKIIRLETAKVSSRIIGEGLQGALRSPTFILDKDKIVIRAAGHHSTLRIILDNFQLIQDPIYGELEKKVDDPGFKQYIFNLKMWKGRRAYVEILPGQYRSKFGKMHHFEIPNEAWIEAEYVFATDEENVTSLPYVQSKNKEVGVPAALHDWVNNQSTGEQIDYLNKAIRQQKLTLSIANGLSYLKGIEKIAKSLYDSTFYAGVVEGDAQFSPVFIRGDCHQPAKEIQPRRYLTALEAMPTSFSDRGSGRPALANAIASPENPLTARVMVNRVWHHLFGRGIVETVDNFGLQGKLPTNPELLDHLAVTFINEGWSIKKLIRTIVLSDAFKRSTKGLDQTLKADPDNITLHRFPLRRLEAEAIRDAILAVSGRLDSTLYGPPFEVYLTEFMKGRGRPVQSGPIDGYGRRSIYQVIRRNFLPPFMLAFDMPAPFSTFGRRNESNVPAQSLSIMNDPFVHEMAKIWAENLIKANLTDEAKITWIYLQAFSRKPTEKERTLAIQFIKSRSAESDQNRIWSDYCHAVFNMKEFTFLL